MNKSNKSKGHKLYYCWVAGQEFMGVSSPLLLIGSLQSLAADPRVAAVVKEHLATHGRTAVTDRVPNHPILADVENVD